MLLAIGMLLPIPRIASLLPEICSLGDTIGAGLFCTLLLELDCESRGSMGGEGGGRLGAIAEDDFVSEAFQNLRDTALTAVGKTENKMVHLIFDLVPLSPSWIAASGLAKGWSQPL